MWRPLLLGLVSVMTLWAVGTSATDAVQPPVVKTYVPNFCHCDLDNHLVDVRKALVKGETPPDIPTGVEATTISTANSAESSGPSAASSSPDVTTSGNPDSPSSGNPDSTSSSNPDSTSSDNPDSTSSGNPDSTSSSNPDSTSSGNPDSTSSGSTSNGGSSDTGEISGTASSTTVSPGISNSDNSTTSSSDLTNSDSTSGNTDTANNTNSDTSTTAADGGGSGGSKSSDGSATTVAGDTATTKAKSEKGDVTTTATPTTTTGSTTTATDGDGKTRDPSRNTTVAASNTTETDTTETDNTTSPSKNANGNGNEKEKEDPSTESTSSTTTDTTTTTNSRRRKRSADDVIYDDYFNEDEDDQGDEDEEDDNHLNDHVSSIESPLESDYHGPRVRVKRESLDLGSPLISQKDPLFSFITHQVEYSGLKMASDQGVMYDNAGNAENCSCEDGSVVTVKLCILDLPYESDLGNARTDLHKKVSNALLMPLTVALFKGLVGEGGVKYYRRNAIKSFEKRDDTSTWAKMEVVLSTRLYQAEYHVKNAIEPFIRSGDIGPYKTDHELCLNTVDITPPEPVVRSPVWWLRYICLPIALGVIVLLVVFTCIGKRDAYNVTYW